MPFIRYNRDKRGYETTLVMHAYRTAQGAQQHRVLYLFRSPSSMQVGRQALDEEVVEALEHTHPNLAFDWPGLLRERTETRNAENRPRPRKGAQKGMSGSGAARSAAAGRPPAEPVVVEDETLLGRVLGADEAARLRRRHAELLQRIGRRARTPEDRDRLSERAGRLNPDDWSDEAAVRASAATLDAELDAIAEELPQRRRGRRGGRRRAAGGGPSSDVSAIMGASGESDAEDRQVAGADRDADADGDSRRVGADAGAQGPEPDDVQGEV